YVFSSIFSLMSVLCFLGYSFFDVPAPTLIYTLSLHDALPIYGSIPLAGLGASQSPASMIHARMPGSLGWAIWLGFVPSGLAYRKDRKSTRLNSSHVKISYAVFCLKKKKTSICS